MWILRWYMPMVPTIHKTARLFTGAWRGNECYGRYDEVRRYDHGCFLKY